MMYHFVLYVELGTIIQPLIVNGESERINKNENKLHEKIKKNEIRQPQGLGNTQIYIFRPGKKGGNFKISLPKDSKGSD